MVHWVQHIDNDRFGHFDYGWVKNMLKYKSRTPPEYDVSKVDVDVAIFTGSTDAMADPTDVKKFISKLPQERIVFQKEIPQ